MTTEEPPMPDPTHCRLHTHTDGCDDEHPCPWTDAVLTPANQAPMLLTIHPDGTVEAPSIEAASEAGRVFVESVRARLAPLGESVALVDLMEQLAVERERAARLQAQVDAAPQALLNVLTAHTIACTGVGEVSCRCGQTGWISWTAYRQHVVTESLAAPVQPRAEGGE